MLNLRLMGHKLDFVLIEGFGKFLLFLSSDHSVLGSGELGGCLAGTGCFGQDKSTCTWWQVVDRIASHIRTELTVS